MKHDFTPEPETGGPRPSVSRDGMPELVAIVGIFVVVWIAFVIHFIGNGRW